MYFSQVGLEKKDQAKKNVNKIQIKSGLRKGELSFVELHKVSSQVAERNSNLLQVLNFRCSG